MEFFRSAAYVVMEMSTHEFPQTLNVLRYVVLLLAIAGFVIALAS
jgi:hypothetical protein